MLRRICCGLSSNERKRHGSPRSQLASAKWAASVVLPVPGVRPRRHRGAGGGRRAVGERGRGARGGARRGRGRPGGGGRGPRRRGARGGRRAARGGGGGRRGAAAGRGGGGRATPSGYGSA